MNLIDSGPHGLLPLVAFACLSFWIITFKHRTREWRFELFTIDFSLGALIVSLGASLVLGNAVADLPFSDRLLVSSKTSQAMVLAAGVLFAFGNTLLLGAVSLIGVACSFGICGGCALATGIALYHSGINPAILGVAVALSLVTALLSGWASRSLDPKPAGQPKGAPPRAIKLSRSTRGILVAVFGGIAISGSYLLCTRGAFDEFGLGPYAGSFFFCIGMLVSSIVFSLYFFNIALEGAALPLWSYLRGWPRSHFAGLAGGSIWLVGALSILLAQSGNPAEVPSRSLLILPIASIAVAMGLGLFIWHEFRDARGSGFMRVLTSLVALLAGLIIYALG